MINNKFNELLDLEITDQRIQDCLKTYGDKYTVKEMPGYVYLNYFDIGISFCFKQNKLECVYFYNDCINGYKQFKDALPIDLNWKLFNKDIVEKFGDSKVKGGGPRASNIWIAYERLGIEFNFLNKIWEDLENPIIHISLFKAKEDNFCSVCLNEIKNVFECDGCSLVRYCSEKCKNMHINFHKKFCS
jgi:hypothetical protein